MGHKSRFKMWDWGVLIADWLDCILYDIGKLSHEQQIPGLTCSHLACLLQVSPSPSLSLVSCLCPPSLSIKIMWKKTQKKQQKCLYLHVLCATQNLKKYNQIYTSGEERRTYFLLFAKFAILYFSGRTGNFLESLLVAQATGPSQAKRNLEAMWCVNEWGVEAVRGDLVTSGGEENVKQHRLFKGFLIRCLIYWLNIQASYQSHKKQGSQWNIKRQSQPPRLSGVRGGRYSS